MTLKQRRINVDVTSLRQTSQRRCFKVSYLYGTKFSDSKAVNVAYPDHILIIFSYLREENNYCGQI